MAEFIDSVNDNRLRALLDVATKGKGGFRRFKDVLQEHPEQRERWFAFQIRTSVRIAGFGAGWRARASRPSHHVWRIDPGCRIAGCSSAS